MSRVVLITIDTLRIDSFERSMPRTRAFAAGGRRFERCYAASSSTQPTHATLLTGLHPWEHGVSRNGVPLSPERITAAEHLRSAGFHTAAVVASFPLHARFGLGQGFDLYDDRFLQVGTEKSWQGIPIDEQRFYDLADSVTDRALELLAAAPRAPQHFWLHYFDPHDPYGDVGESVLLPDLLDVARGGGPEAGAWLQRSRRLYEADVARLDVALGRVFDALAASADAFETHVVFAADHGESFGERGALGHGHRLTPAQLHVPCFVVSPRVEAGPVAAPVGSADLHATLLSLAGLAPTDSRGRDLTADFDAATRVVGMRRTYGAGQQVLVAGRPVSRGPRFYAVVDGVVWAGDRDGIVRNDDPSEPSPPRALARELATSFESYQRILEQQREAPEALDEETQRGLEALGYAQ